VTYSINVVLVTLEGTEIWEVRLLGNKYIFDPFSAELSLFN